MNIEIGQVVSQIIAFLIMLWILRRYAWEPILSFLDERRAKIKSEFDAIEAERRELDRQQGAYKKQLEGMDDLAHAKMQEAVEKGRQVAYDIEKKAQGEAKTLIQRAQADTQLEINKAKVQLKNELVAMTLAATEKVLQKELGPEKQKQIMDDFVNQTETK